MSYRTRPFTPEARAGLKGVTRTSSPFRGTWTDTLQTLNTELWHLGVRGDWVMQIDITEDDLKLNGELRSTARPASPAVAIAIETKDKGSLLFVCGRFPTWKDNVRGIALGLKALRTVERYGIVQSNESYRGWQAIGSGTPMGAAPAFASAEDAARFLASKAGWSGTDVPASLLRDHTVTTAAYRDAAKRHHPDAGGDAATFRRLTEARDLLLASAA